MADRECLEHGPLTWRKSRYLRKDGTYGDRWVCKPCEARKSKAWRAANRQQSRDIVRRRKFIRVYGITLEERDRMIAERDGRCDICGERPNQEWKRKEDRCLHVDHCHTSGRVRGMLCGPCNRSLGWHERFSKQAERYLNG